MIEKNKAMLKCIVIILFIIVTLKLSLVFLWPFVGAVLLSIVIEPFVAIICNIKISRKIGVFISFIIISFVTIASVYYLGNYLYNQGVILIKKLPDIIGVISDKLPFLNINRVDFNGFIKTIERIIPEYRNKIIDTLISTANGFMYFILIFITSIYISIEKQNLISIIRKYLPNDIFSLINKIGKKSTDIIKIQIKLVAATTIQTVLGLYILGIPQPLILGLICGILDILPVIGTSIVFIPLMFYEFIMGNLITGIGLVLLYILLEINRKIMEIKFIGNNLRLHPIITVFSIYAGLKIYGVWGVIFGPFLIVFIVEIFNYYFKGERGIHI